MRSYVLGAAALSLMAAGFGCKERTANVASVKDTAPVASASSPQTCVAVRGNGAKIPGHFNPLARLIERMGVFDGISGGSSGSITSFLYESILANQTLAKRNPQAPGCFNGAGCSDDVKTKFALETSLMVKALLGYIEQAYQSLDPAAVQVLLNDFQTLKSGGDTADKVAALIAKVGPSGSLDPAAVTAAIGPDVAKILSPELAPTLAGLINPELTGGGAVPTSADQTKLELGHVQMVFKEGAGFDGANRDSFLRPGLLDWDKIPGLFGKVGDFFAGRSYGADYQAAYNSFLDTCAQSSAGKSWQQVAYSLDASGQPTPSACGQLFNALFATKQNTALTDRPRVSEYPGEAMTALGKPLALMVSVSVYVGGDKLTDWSAAHQQYLQLPNWSADPTKPLFDLKNTESSISWQPDPSAVYFGYYGRDADLLAVQKSFNAQRKSGGLDAKSDRFAPIGQFPWQKILGTSPAEPGLAPFRPINWQDGDTSPAPAKGWANTWSGTSSTPPMAGAGGWSDLTPSLVLKAMGCQSVGYVTRNLGDEFTVQVAAALNIDAATLDALYSTTAPQSAISLANSQMSVSSCIDWDSTTNYPDLKPQTLLKMADDSYCARLWVNPASANLVSLFTDAHHATQPPLCNADGDSGPMSPTRCPWPSGGSK